MSVNKRKLQLESKKELKSSPYTKCILEYLNYCNDEVSSLSESLSQRSSEDDIVDPNRSQQMLLLRDDQMVGRLGMSHFVARWIRESLIAQYNNLNGLLDPPQIHKTMERLIVYLINYHNLTQRKSSKTVDKNGVSLASPSRKKQSTLLSPSKHANSSGSTSPNYFNAAVVELEPENAWCPTKSYFVSVEELMSRTANFASLDQSVPEEMNHNFRLLIGMITNSSNPANRDRLVIKGRNGEVPVQLSSSISCIPEPNMIDSIVFVSSWRLVVVPPQEPGSDIAYDSTRNVVNYIEVQRLHVLYRGGNNFFQKVLDGFYRQTQTIPSLSNFILSTYKPTSHSLDHIKTALKQQKSPSINNGLPYNILIQIQSKSSVLASKTGQFFFAQASFVKKDKSNNGNINKEKDSKENTFYIMFSDDMTKWFQLLEVGNQYLIANTTVKLIFGGTRKERVMFHVYDETKIFHIATSTSDTRITLDSKTLLDKSAVLPQSLDYIGYITSDYNVEEGSYMMDDHRVFFTHYACKGFFGSGIRVGTKIKLENVHPIYVNNIFQGLGVCSNSSFKFLSFVNNQTLRNFQPFHVSPFYPLWSKYSIIDSFTIPKILGRLKTKFPAIFKDIDSFMKPFKNGFIYDQIASSFGIEPVHQFKKSEDVYEIFFNHDNQCHYNKQKVQFPNILEVSQISRPKDIIKSDRYLNNLKYSLIGRFELEPQSYEWGKVYIKDDKNSSFVICNIVDLNEYHLNYIWKINNFMINLEVYTDEDNSLKTITFIQFSMSDCDMIAPIDIDRHLLSNNESECRLYQDRFDSLQHQAKTFCDLGFLFFKLIGKITRYGKLSLSAILLIPGLPLVKIDDVPTNYYPALQISNCYYIDQCTEKPTKHTHKYVKKIKVNSNVQIKTIAFIDSSESRLTPQNLTTDLIHNFSIPMVTVQNDELFDQIDRFEVGSNNYTVQELNELDTKQLYKKDHFNFVTFVGAITRHSIETNKGKLSLILWCRDIFSTSGMEICVILSDYHFGIVEGLVVKFSNLNITTGGSGARNICYSNRYSYFTVLSTEHVRVSPEEQSGANSPILVESNVNNNNSNNSQQMSNQHYLQRTTIARELSTGRLLNSFKNFDLEHENDISYGGGGGTGRNGQNTLTKEEAIRIIEIFDYDNRKKEDSSSSSSSSPIFSRASASEDGIEVVALDDEPYVVSPANDPNVPDYSKALLLSDVNRSTPPDTLCKVVADITDIIYVEISYLCNNCKQPTTAIKCKCNLDSQDVSSFKFNGFMECEVSDGSSIKSVLIKNETIISKVLNIYQSNLIKIKDQLIHSKKVGNWAKSSDIMKSMNTKFNSLETIDLALAGAWKADQHKSTTYQLVVNKDDVFGNVLFCHQLEIVDSRDQAWSVMDYVNQPFNSMLS